MSDFSLTLVLRLTTSKIINDVAKVQIKSEKITPFGGVFHVRELFSRYVGPDYRQSAGHPVHIIRLQSYAKLHTSPPSKQENYSQSLQTLDLKHLAL